ncbi:hypothetical protein CPSG_00967 [Coccidioides posadasii str. Silveira]|uniref:Uncharacterized protein n=1 Tax=Coccidioides posadasii (strain RMSCC 757 / Silveira) TaxID=443226 RepID=E9CU32_COCPS|nr:hypothetical protein CPSG_00967 [Coccidioides posadasii str. Silveira]
MYSFFETPTNWLRAGSLDLGGGGRRNNGEKESVPARIRYVRLRRRRRWAAARICSLLGRVRNLLRPPWKRAIFNSPLCFGVLLDFILSLSCGIKSNPGLNTTSHWRKSLLRSPPALLHEVAPRRKAMGISLASLIFFNPYLFFAPPPFVGRDSMISDKQYRDTEKAYACADTCHGVLFFWGEKTGREYRSLSPALLLDHRI